MKNTYRIWHTIALILSVSCNDVFLEVKPDQGLLVPAKLSDMQQILDNIGVMNKTPAFPTLSSDDFSNFTAGALSSLSQPERNAYLWQSDIYEGTSSFDWDYSYEQVFYSNVVLDGLEKIHPNNLQRQEWEEHRGSALFFRAMAFHYLVSQFAWHYDPLTANELAGIPLKLTSDVNDRPDRASITQVFERIIKDLEEAYLLLPTQQDVRLSRPSKLAVSALLARIHLHKGNYKKALDYADEVIQIKPNLLDYNSLPKTSNRPISYSDAAESEIIFFQTMASYRFITSTSAGISPEIIESYGVNDLRKNIFLRDRGNGLFTFKGNYTGDGSFFTGLTTGEVYLIRAECRARLGDNKGALEDLNFLLKHRWDNSVTFVAIEISNIEQTLLSVLKERRKEMITRGQRWVDLKRLNLESRFAKTLRRTINEVEYALPPNDKKYVFPIPNDEIHHSGIPQNDR